MKKHQIFMFVGVIVSIFLFFTFSVKIRPAEVGIKVDLYGSDKGVEIEVLPTGRSFYNAISHDIVKYPSFIQQGVYDGMSFQDVDGLSLGVDVAIDYKFVAESIPTLYTEYRQDADFITRSYFPVWIKNALVQESAKMRVDEIYGVKKEEFRENVKQALISDLEEKGIFIDEIYFTNGIAIPQVVRQRIDSKIEATQKAQQKENELRAVTADAQKKIAEEKGRAESRIIEAESRAKANSIINASLTPQYLEFRELEMQQLQIEKWNGVTPSVVNSGSGLILDLKK